MPDRYVKRRSINDFERDPPITEVGRFQSKLIGKFTGSLVTVLSTGPTFQGPPIFIQGNEC